PAPTPVYTLSLHDALPISRDMESQVQRQVREMGIDPLAAGRIRLDTGEREGKRSRAFCAPLRIPDEVYLVLHPHGGQTDWSTFRSEEHTSELQSLRHLVCR